MRRIPHVAFGVGLERHVLPSILMAMQLMATQLFRKRSLSYIEFATSGMDEKSLICAMFKYISEGVFKVGCKMTCSDAGTSESMWVGLIKSTWMAALAAFVKVSLFI